MSGHLRRRGGGGTRGGGSTKWKRSWFVLKDRVLYAYKASEDTVAVETLPVLGWSLDHVNDVSITYASNSRNDIKTRNHF